MIYTNVFPGGKMKALTMSYDDGVDQDVDLIAMMRKYGVKGTFNINSGWFGNGNTRGRRLNAEEAKQLYMGGGVEVAVHGYKHAYLDRLVPDMVAFEIAQDRYQLEKLTGYPVRGMAYAYGAYTDKVVEQLRNLGIVYSRTTENTGKFSLPADFLRWHPTCHHSDPKLFELCDTFLNRERIMDLQVFYIWGHSYEFDRNDNWDLMERFLQKMSGHDDIWYATNIEIYEYMQACKRLITSVDGTMIYNPSAVDVWVKHNRHTKLCIPAGKMVTLSEE